MDLLNERYLTLEIILDIFNAVQNYIKHSLSKEYGQRGKLKLIENDYK